MLRVLQFNLAKGQNMRSRFSILNFDLEGAFKYKGKGGGGTCWILGQEIGDDVIQSRQLKINFLSSILNVNESVSNFEMIALLKLSIM